MNQNHTRREDAPGAPAAIGKQQIARFNRILARYKTGKANLERRIIDNEQWWKLRHNDPGGDPDAASAWLCNVIMTKHADAMDAYPTCTLLPQEERDTALSRQLSAILPVVLRQCQFERVYSDVWWYKLKSGTGCYKVFWDGSKLGGLGDIAIGKVNLLNLFWEPGVEDIQDSAYVFHVELWNNERLVERWPWLQGKLQPNPMQVSRFLYDDSVDTTGKSLVVDVYYKRGGQLHYCKYVGSHVLYATENTGLPLYDHGQYPFVLDVLFPTEGSCCGYGYIDFGKRTQRYIDQMNGAIMQNALAASVPRWFIRSDGGINEAEYADLSKPFVHVGGNLGEDSVRQIVTSPLDDLYMTVLQSRITELKETLGNRDSGSGGVTASVTSAAGIASLQEAAGKLSRDAEKTSYRAYSQVVYLCLELIRQFYSVERSFRITGPMGEPSFVRFDNRQLSDPMASPRFDIEVAAQRESPYTKERYNELALQLFQLGALNPGAAQQTMLMLELMDFKGKDQLQRRISQNAQQLQKQLQQLQKQKASGGSVSSLAVGSQEKDEHPFVKNARMLAQNASRPR